MSWRVIVIAAVAAALVVGAATSQAVVSASGDVERAREQERSAERSRDQVRGDVRTLEERLAEYEQLLGWDPTPVRTEPVELPEGVSANLLTGDLAVGDFRDVFIDEGIVLRGVSAKEVDEVPLQDVDTYPPKPQPPLKVRKGYRFVHVLLQVRNRSGDAADPGCGMGASIANHAYDDQGEPLSMSKAYEDADTYAEACGDGIADGATAPVAFTVELPEDRTLAALQFSFLGDGDDDDSGSDGVTQTLVFADPV